MSLSDESDNDELARLQSAVDPSFTLDPIPKLNSTNKTRESIRRTHNYEWDSGHTFQTLKLAPESKRFLRKKLGDALTKQIKFVKLKKMDCIPHRDDITSEDKDNGIYLFSNSKTRLSSRDLLHHDRQNNTIHKKLKPKLKKRKLQDDIESEDESTKLKSVAVSFEWVINKNI